MADEYGSDFLSIVDEEGVEYELEVLSTLDYNGETYLAVVPADQADGDSLEVSILKSTDDEQGEPMLCAVEDERELDAVYAQIMQQLYDEDDSEES